MSNNFVITRFGLGNVLGGNERIIKVRLDKPFLNKEILELKSRGEVFQFCDYAVLMVINAPQATLSNIQFYPTKEKAEEVINLPRPPDQSCCLLDLKNLTFELNFKPGPLINKGFTWQSAWLDRWGINDINNFPLLKEAKAFVAEYRQKMHSTTVGIVFSALLDMEKKDILSYIVLTEVGIVLDRGPL